MSTLLTRIRKKKRFIYPFVVIFLLVGLFFLVEITYYSKQPSISDEMEIGSSQTFFDGLFWDYFHREDINKFRKISQSYSIAIPQNIVKEYYAKIGPYKMLEVLDENPQCHTQGHNVGKEIYYQTKNLAQSTNLCQAKCTSGCFHGILMGMFSPDPEDTSKHVTYEEVQAQIKTICDNDEVKSTVNKGVCVHGVGHVLTVLHNYNLQSALTSCNILEDPGLVYYCATGVYMEREFIYHKEDNSISQTFPCDSSPFPAACYRYKLLVTFKADEYSQSKSLCSGLNNARQKRGCFHGLGYRSHGIVLKDPSKLEVICSDTDKIAEKMCIEGAIGYLREINKKAALDTCTQVNSDLKEICNNAIQVGNFGLNRDFEQYVN